MVYLVILFMNQTIKLQDSSILHVPLDKYPKDFLFIVNGEEYHTSFIFADLLSPKISKIHYSDPTMSTYLINTETKGDFNRFINLQNFKELNLNENDLPFFSEIIQELETDSFNIEIPTPKLTIDNIFEQFNKHFLSPLFYSKQYESEIDFISSNFPEILKQHKQNLSNLPIEVLQDIFQNNNLQLDTEDELLEFINEVYKQGTETSILYSYVYFSNVEINSIDTFLNIFNICDLTSEVWNSISNRLRREIVKNEELKVKRYRKGQKSKSKDKKREEFLSFPYLNREFEGILNSFKSNIDSEVKPTSSSSFDGTPSYILSDDTSYLGTSNKPNSWVCFEFVKRRIIPTHYTIRSIYYSSYHLRSWIVEGSEDGREWEKLDEQKDCSLLNGANIVHTFPVSNNEEHEFKFIRISTSGKNWGNTDALYMSRIEFYGQISQ